tara:strand:- start:545 stop:787 length:243 start_codon:yes stop_codon:yes gene_type:complete
MKMVLRERVLVLSLTTGSSLSQTEPVKLVASYCDEVRDIGRRLSVVEAKQLNAAKGRFEPLEYVRHVDGTTPEGYSMCFA